ncbi:hypothetical protein V6917_12905 [Pectobacterium brasiliense]|uniref:hypothetical protein n=1 Tax=Pectobacterium brasiliense TaxID=180957 RepID=UPI0030CD8AEB
MDPLGLDYSVWQIHSPGYNDIVQKGLHFYSPGNVELSVRPDHKGGITFKNAMPNQTKPNQAGNDKVERAIIEAKKKFETDARFRNDIVSKSDDGIKSVLEHAKRESGSLRDLANGRSSELKDISRNVKRFNSRVGCN